MPNAKLLNACREEIRCFRSRTALEDIPSVVSSLPQPLKATSNLQIPAIANEVLAGFVAPPHSGDECPVRLAQTFTTGNVIQAAEASLSTSTARYLWRSQFLGNLASSVSDFSIKNRPRSAVSTVYQPDIS